MGAPTLVMHGAAESMRSPGDLGRGVLALTEARGTPPPSTPLVAGWIGASPGRVLGALAQ